MICIGKTKCTSEKGLLVKIWNSPKFPDEFRNGQFSVASNFLKKARTIAFPTLPEDFLLLLLFLWANKPIRIVCARDIIKMYEPLEVLSSSGIRATKFISVYNFPVQ